MKKGLWGLLFLMLLAGCTKKVRLEVPQGHLESQTASADELVELINQRYSGIDTLTLVGARIEFVSRFADQGFAREYPGGKAQLIARSPDAIYLNILNPLTSTTAVTMASEQNRFQIWVPRENKYLVGDNNVQVNDPNPIYQVRPGHLLDAILVEPLPGLNDPRRLLIEETEDTLRKYYTITISEPVPGRLADCLQRKLWIERSALHLSRQVYYDCVRPVSRIAYGGAMEIGQKLVSAQVELDRVDANYLLRLGVREGQVRIDRPLRAGTFKIPQPPGAERVEVKGDAVGKPGSPGNTGGNR